MHDKIDQNRASQKLWRQVLLLLITDALGFSQRATDTDSARKTLLRYPQDVAIIVAAAGFPSGFAENIRQWAFNMRDNDWCPPPSLTNAVEDGSVTNKNLVRLHKYVSQYVPEHQRQRAVLHQKYAAAVERRATQTQRKNERLRIKRDLARS